MVSFICDSCQSTIKKPKLQQHFNTCYTSSVSCIDCNNTFDQYTSLTHNQCITEAERYQGKLYQPNKNNKNKQNNSNNNQNNNNNKKQKTEQINTSNRNNHNDVTTATTTQINKDNNNKLTNDKTDTNSNTSSIEDIIRNILLEQQDSISIKKLVKYVKKQCDNQKIDTDNVEQAITKYMLSQSKNIFIQYKNKE